VDFVYGKLISTLILRWISIFIQTDRYAKICYGELFVRRKLLRTRFNPLKSGRDINVYISAVCVAALAQLCWVILWLTCFFHVRRILLLASEMR